MRLVITTIELNGRSAEPIQETADNEEVAKTTDRSPAPRSLLEAATSALLLLLRSMNGEFRVVFQELLVFGVEGQRNGLLGLEEIHDGRRGEGEGSEGGVRRGGLNMTFSPRERAHRDVVLTKSAMRCGLREAEADCGIFDHRLIIIPSFPLLCDRI